MELEDGLTIHFKTKVDDENHIESVFEQTEGEVHMQSIRLSDNIQLHDFEFHGTNEEVFSSASWNEEIRIIDKKLFELASDAGAIYRIDGTVLINRDIFDAYLE